MGHRTACLAWLLLPLWLFLMCALWLPRSVPRSQNGSRQSFVSGSVVSRRGRALFALLNAILRPAVSTNTNAQTDLVPSGHCADRPRCCSGSPRVGVGASQDSLGKWQGSVGATSHPVRNATFGLRTSTYPQPLRETAWPSAVSQSGYDADQRSRRCGTPALCLHPHPALFPRGRGQGGRLVAP